MLDAYSPSDELPNIWQARRLDLLARLAPPGNRSRLQREAEDLYRALGQSPPPPEGISRAASAPSFDEANRICRRP
jgi:hypothetical protein